MSTSATAFTFVTPQVTLARNAGALYNFGLGSSTMSILAGQTDTVGLLNRVYTDSIGNAAPSVVARTLVANLGITGDAATVAEAYVVGQLNAAPSGRGKVINDILTAFTGLTGDATFGTFATAFNTQVSAAVAYANTAGSRDTTWAGATGGTPPPATVSSTNLTINPDVLTGGAADDVFLAYVLNNANTLQSGDRVDGGAGRDRLFADVGNSATFAITPITSSVEEFAVRAQAVGTDSNNNNMADPGLYSNTSLVDAERMSGVVRFESNNSRADLVIEDVRILPSQITKDITVAMVETDPGHVDYGLYFDQYSLRNQTTTTSQLIVEILDTRSEALGTGPLKDNPYSGFTFTLNGVNQTIEAPGIDAALTYDDLLVAINGAITANAALKDVVTASRGAVFNRVDTLFGSSVSGTEIVLTSRSGALATNAALGFKTATGTVPPSSGLHTDIRQVTSSSTDLVTVKVVLDDVGRGSTGGDLVIGGLSVGAGAVAGAGTTHQTSLSQGVQRFEIEVLDNSKLQTINSTNNTLREVTIVNGVTSSSSHAYVATRKDAGLLHVNGVVPVSFDQSNQNTPLPGSGNQHNSYGFSDLRLIDASAMRGDLQFTAEISAAARAKYLNLSDGAPALPATDNVAFRYLGGAGNDVMDTDIDAVAFASTINSSSREDFNFSVDGGAGNDTIHVDLIGNTGPWYADQASLRNVTLSGGDGNDTIRKFGDGNTIINGGAGNDTIYADNTGFGGSDAEKPADNSEGPPDTAGNNTTRWFVASTDNNFGDLQLSTANTGTAFLYGCSVRVTFSGAFTANAGGVTSDAADPDSNGFESTALIPLAQNYTGNQYNVNQAIKAAINGSPVLSKVLAASDGPGHTLVITSLIDGGFAFDDLHIEVRRGTDLVDLGTTTQADVLSRWKEVFQDSTETLADAQSAIIAAVTTKNSVTGMVNSALPRAGFIATNGEQSLAESDNRINPGAGDDVIVLGTGALSNDAIVFTGYDLGRKTIINFSDTGTSQDGLNFSSYLTGVFSVSGSVASQKSIDWTLNADANVEANSVSVAQFTSSPTESFEGLTAARFLAAINSTNLAGASNYGGFSAASYNAVNNYVGAGPGTTLVGGVGKAIVMVENDENDGEYRLFELTFNGLASNATADFSACQEIATVDFGDSIALDLVTVAGLVSFG